jgi:hypothetical protein
MNDDLLLNTLQAADVEPVGHSSLTAESLLAAALRRRRRTAGVRAVIATAAVSAVILAGAWSVRPANRETIANRTSNPPQTVHVAQHSQSPAELSREIVSLEREVAWRRQVVAALAASDDAATNDDEPAASAISNADWLRVEAARSAALSWQYANVVEHEFHDAAAARREYARLVERFPDTNWATLAAASLERLAATKNSSL